MLHSRQDVVGKCGEQGARLATQAPIRPSQVFDQDTEFLQVWQILIDNWPKISNFYKDQPKLCLLEKLQSTLD